MYVIYRRHPSMGNHDNAYVGEIWGIAEDQVEANRIIDKLNKNKSGHTYQWVKVTVLQTLEFLDELKE